MTGLVLISCMAAIAVQAKNKPPYERGVLAEMQSVSCGYMQKSGPTVAGALITGAEHSKSQELLCQEYTLKTNRVTYRIRPKEEKHPALLPVGEEAEFRLKKDQMLLRIPEISNKEHEYVVVSMKPTTELANEIESTRRPPQPHEARLSISGEPVANLAASAKTMAAVNAQLPAASQTAPSSTSAVSVTGAVQVTSVPAGADVFVDSASAGRTPTVLNLKPGAHSIQVVMAGYKDWVKDVNVLAGTQQQLTAKLSR